MNQRDLGFGENAAKADASNWDKAKVLEFVGGLLARQQYDAVFTLLPTAETHGHHRAAAELARQAIAALPASHRPVLLGAEAQSRAEIPMRFEGRPPALVFDRTARFGYREALSYQIVANWVIAEHKSQGLFQMDCGKHDMEEFWVLEGGENAMHRVEEWKGRL